MFGVEAQCALNMFVPIGPIVGAGEFGVFVRNAEILQMRVKIAVGFDEEVAGAAIYAQSRLFGAIGGRRELFGERVTIVGAAAALRADNARKFALFVAPLAVRETVGARMSIGRNEKFGIFERQFNRAIAAHRKPADAAPAPLGNRVEMAVNEGNQILRDGAFISEAFVRVGVESAPAVGHHDHHRQHLNVAPNAAFALPHGEIVGQTVQKIENRKRASVSRDFGHDDVASGLFLQRIGEKMKCGDGHDPKSIAKKSLPRWREAFKF